MFKGPQGPPGEIGTSRTAGATRSSGAEWTVHSGATGKLNTGFFKAKFVSFFLLMLPFLFQFLSPQGAPAEKGEKGEIGLPGPQVRKNILPACLISNSRQLHNTHTVSH